MNGLCKVDGLVIDPSTTNVVKSNYSFLDQFSKNGGTDAMFINSINISSRIKMLFTESNCLINRSLVADFTEYLILAIINRCKLDGDRFQFGDDDTLNRFILYSDNYMSYIDASSQVLSIYKDQIGEVFLIDQPLYDTKEYLENLRSKKSKYHYSAIYNRCKMVDSDPDYGVMNMMMKDIFNYIYGQLCQLSGIKCNLVKVI